MILASSLSYTYPFSHVPALKDITLSIGKGELILITGPTAAGKTTLCLALAGILHHELGGIVTGHLSFLGRSINEYDGMRELSQHISMVFDDADAQLIFTSVEEEIASGLETRLPTAGERHDRINEVMNICEISHLAKRPPYALSGGQKQRVAIAAAFAMDTEVLILDEPTSELDVHATGKIIDILQELRAQGKTIIIVDHSLEGYRGVANRVYEIREGHIARQGTFDELFPEVQGSVKALYDEPDLSPYVEPDDKPIIRIADLHRKYGDVHALNGVNVSIFPGEFVALLGENGSGKTTLVKHFNGLLRPDKGTIKVLDLDATKEEIMTLVRHTGLVFQNPDTMLFADTVDEEIRFGLSNINIHNPDTRIQEVLSMVRLTGQEQTYPRHLSRGERQRLAVSCILAMEPEIIVLDEPTTGLDEEESDRMMNLMKSLQAKGHTIIMVTHNMRIAEEYADRIIAMEEGKIIGNYAIKRGTAA
jgi:energy-coupling factor transport system ATP-binding protein